MHALSPKSIALSKLKSALMVMGSLGFVIGGIAMVVFSQSISAASNGADDPAYIQAMGFAAVFFFGLTGYIGARTLFDKKPGLVLDNKGIMDNSSGLAAGFVPWSDVTKIGENTIKGQRFACLFVSNPKAYVERGGWIAQGAKNTNIKITGTPINIGAHSLKIGHDDLMTALQDYFNAYGAKPHSA